MRLFIAIPLAEAVETELKRLTARLHPAAPNLRWSAPQSWHITLQFLGNTNEEQYPCLLPRLSALKAAPFAIEFEGLGVFDRAGVFFLGVAPSPPLLALHKKVIAATQSCGFEPEDRPYHPHITLARSKSGDRGPRGQVFVRGVENRGPHGQVFVRGDVNPGRELRTLLARAGARVHFDRFTASEFLLYESHLSSAGSRYEVKCRFPLTG
jgi:RNA 2',3'-cyclic 3'-phosphodiesterase